MYFKAPKNDFKTIWTRHAVSKMRQYGLSENCLKRLLRNSIRQEEGIAPDTTAIMQVSGSKKHPTEIWLMYQKVGEKIKIVTAWRYPGISPKKEIPMPEDIKGFVKNYKPETQ
ncbi:MAG: hypothetical protein WC499_00190 [Patescibacteria group bacterium]